VNRRGSTELVNSLVLVVSHPQLRKLVVKVLLRDGFIVLEAHNAASALAVVESLASAIALVITDDELPDMDGSDLTSQVKQRLPGVLVLLFQSAAIRPDTAPADGFLCKPFEPAKLLEAVRLLLRERLP
jgi:DNA-binding response OmpR family regulator